MATAKRGIAGPTTYSDAPGLLGHLTRLSEDEALWGLAADMGVTVDPDADRSGAYRAVALALARLHYPLRMPAKRGRRSKWTDIRAALLYVEVQRKMDAHPAQVGPEWACERLAKVEPWRTFMNGCGDPAGALLKAYRRTKPSPDFLRAASSGAQQVLDRFGESGWRKLMKQLLDPDSDAHAAKLAQRIAET